LKYIYIYIYIYIERERERERERLASSWFVLCNVSYLMITQLKKTRKNIKTILQMFMMISCLVCIWSHLNQYFLVMHSIFIYLFIFVSMWWDNTNFQPIECLTQQML
jgi:hypothetical protein